MRTLHVPLCGDWMVQVANASLPEAVHVAFPELGAIASSINDENVGVVLTLIRSEATEFGTKKLPVDWSGLFMKR